MAGIDEVLERLVTDPGFRIQLKEEPRSALEGYVLYDEDLEVLAATLDEGEAAEHGVEQRTSKSAFLGAFLGGSGGGGSGGSPGELAAPPGSEEDVASRSQCKNNLKQIGIAMHGEEDPGDLVAPATGAQDDAPAGSVPGDPPTAGPAGGPPAGGPPDEPGPGRERPGDGATWETTDDGAGTWSDHDDADPGVGREPEGTPGVAFPDLAQGSDAPPPDGFSAPPDRGPEPMNKSELTQRLAERTSGNDAPTDDLAPGDAAEEVVQPTYPGVYVEEVASPESGDAPPEASLSSAEAEQHTEEAETVHAFIKANGTDLQGESTESGDPDDTLGDGAGRQDTDR